MNKPFGGLILNIAFRMLVPFTMVYAVYILCLGECSPGGGVQAGALLSVGVLLARLILGFDTKFNVLGKTSVVLAGVGTFIYALTGWLTLLGGADFFLNYNVENGRKWIKLPDKIGGLKTTGTFQGYAVYNDKDKRSRV